MAQTARLRSLYRSLLRELPPVRSSPPPALTSTATYARPSRGPRPRNRPPAHAEQLAAYLRSQRLYVMLVERYNSGAEMSGEERVRLTARRVGMNMPKLYQE